MRRILIGSTAAACALALVTAGAAFARAGDRTAALTYPVATALCVAAHNDVLPSRLTAAKTQVLTACDTLLSAYGPLVATVDGAESTLLGTLSTQKGLVSAACPRPVVSASACQTARSTAISVDGAARLTEVGAVTAFHTAVEANRSTFWTTIQSLRSAA
jgi:hypothetical protein